ncbi:DUF4339 domain-containing protein [Pseudomarimonas arenosa]|uniref:DUF4339 domain-containing protein n=1 Tax=Pseudomarimonas arenosa TaxID=2774145 RepID=A0AAW3ZI92_9GAMM|nr:DUF4339 domain-containing protein [Pseudomarimonas arenosa]MBD8525503.1 DUF4339 domain-containing protein [Pseudomarimonas arenosa]
MDAPLEDVDDWYYNNADGEQVGPLSTADLRSAYQLSRIRADTLIWREGMASWRELHKLAPDLGIRIFINAERFVAPATSERLVMPRWLGIAIVLALLLGFMIWLPTQFSMEVERPSPLEVERRVADSRGLQIEIDRIVERTGQCPSNGQHGLKAPADYAEGALRAIRIHPKLDDKKVCVIDLIFSGQRVRISRQAEQGWQVHDAPATGQ